jgi:hypothetical protein
MNADELVLRIVYLQVPGCVRFSLPACPTGAAEEERDWELRANGCAICSVQVNLAAETGDMGVLANHVPSIEQLKPGLVEIIEESGGSKQFFCTCI